MLDVALWFITTIVRSGKDLRNHLLKYLFPIVEEKLAHDLSRLMQVNTGGVRTRPRLVCLHHSGSLFTMSETLLL